MGRRTTRTALRLLTIQGDPETAFYLQHDARFQPNGNISLFDDHSATAGVRSGPRRRVRDRPQRRHGPVVWQYQGAASSGFLGSFRRYADGTNLIGWGAYSGTANLVFSDVDSCR